jgi:mycofactocin precursor
MTVTNPATGPTTGTVDGAAVPAGADESDDLATPMVEEELLVEEISIDGMCGVY